MMTDERPDDAEVSEGLPVKKAVDLGPVNELLAKIRPAWRAKSLIDRVTRLLPVDPSSACQRLFNATVHDLREKVLTAGLDIARDAGDLHKLPPVAKPEDVENYSSANLIDLAYRMGILAKPDWRRLKRCYDIRRDLEHEDDVYEAGPEDCFYIFKTCIEVVLSREPVEILRVADVKDAIEQEGTRFPEQQFFEEYASAHDARQREIVFFLVSTAIDDDKPDLVRVNSVEMLRRLRDATRTSVRIEVAGRLQKHVGRKLLDTVTMKVSHAAGAAAYLKQSSRNGFFAEFLERLKIVGHNWAQYEYHADLLEELEDVGGLAHCADEKLVKDILRWLVLCYVGTPGGRTRYGNVRAVFYSNDAAPIISRLIQSSSGRELQVLKALREDRNVKRVLAMKTAIASRYEDLLDLAGDV